MDENAPISVHLAEWPTYDETYINDGLNREMALVMKLASLGHAARNKANRKVRQPLAEVAFAVSNLDEMTVPLNYAELLEDELNVKQVRMLSAAGEAVSFSLNPLPKQLGQKYGSRFPGIRQALLAVDAAPAAQKLLAGASIDLQVNGDPYTILPDEVEVRMQAREGYAVAAEGAYLAALTTELTPELAREGLAREFVRRVQDLRKSAGLDISDRIRVRYSATPLLAEAVEAFRSYVMNETLALDLAAGEAEEGMAVVDDEFDGEQVSVALSRAGA
jgi:isoleucyl-tRNA synthetase